MLQNNGQALFYHFGELKKIPSKFWIYDLIPEQFDPTLVPIL